MRHFLLILLAGAVLAGSAYLALRPRPIGVDIAEVTRGPFEETVEEDGWTRVRDRYLVSAPLAGRLLRPSVRAGDRVAGGDVLATILPPYPALLDPRARQEAEERIGAAEAAVEEADVLRQRVLAVLLQAEAEAQRVRALRREGVVPPQQLERAELTVATAERDLRAAEQRRHAAEHLRDEARALLLRLADATTGPGERWLVRAPLSGVVLRVRQESEAMVAAGAPLFELGDLEDLEVVAEVLTTRAVGIPAGARTTILGWGGPDPLQGRVRQVEPGGFTKVSALGVEEQRVRVLIDLMSPSALRRSLGDGFRVDVRIVVHEADDATRVPVGALFRREAGWAVFAVADGRARERPVTLDRRGATIAAVRSGLTPGDRVILFPPAALRDGAGVAMR